MALRWGWVVIAVGVAVGAGSVASAGTVGPYGEEIDFDVPDFSQERQCRTEELGQLSAIAGVDNTTMVTVIGFQRTYRGAWCGRELHFLKLVLHDPARSAGEAYVDPMRGKGGDNEPWFDGEVRDKLASETGEFGGPDNNLSKTPGWSRDTKLDLVFGDKPENLRPGMEVVTLLVTSDGKRLIPIAGVAWGFKADGSSTHLDWPRYGERLTQIASLATLQAALKRSGFGDYVVKASCCAPAATERKHKGKGTR